MAKDNELIFDSDRVAKRERIRKIIIPVAIVFGVLALALIIALIAGVFRNEAYVGGGDTPFPYTWKVSKNGAVTLEIENGNYPGYSWIYTDTAVYGEETGSAGTVTPGGTFIIERNKAQPKNKTRFELNTVASGRDNLVFRLANNNDPEDVIYEYDLFTQADEENGRYVAGIISGYVTEMPGKIFGGDINQYSYQLHRDTSGDNYIAVENNTGRPFASDWKFTSSNRSIIRTDGQIEEGNVIKCYFRPGGTPGNCRLRVSSMTDKFELMIDISVGSDLSITVTKHILLIDNVEVATVTERNTDSTAAPESVVEQVPDGMNPKDYVITDSNGEQYFVTSDGEEMKFHEDAISKSYRQPDGTEQESEG